MSDRSIRVSYLQIFPIKSLDPVSLPAVTLLPDGPIQNDRRWALFDADEKVVNAKRFPALQRIRTEFSSDWTQLTVRFADAQENSGSPEQFAWPGEMNRFAARVSDFLERPVQLREAADFGFPDDRDASGPTFIGSATLRELTHWYPEISHAEFRRRFRANIELDTGEPFWEDRLFNSPEQPQRFQIGDVSFLGINPCQRCAVPARNSWTGKTTEGFQKQFMQLRKESLPAFANREQFNHFYRLAVNTRLDSETSGYQLRVGDELTFA